jgi:exopolyphosphatase/guanosine-5'-triphosphate,3'-diphosphate pyrophosphatase
MRKAAIDIGSHSILLLIADLSNGTIRPVHEGVFSPRLASGLSSTGKLDKQSMETAGQHLKQVLEICDRYEVTDIKAVATAAVREATNGGEFVDWMKDSLDLKIRIIDGDEEARLTYYGAISGLEATGKIAVLDVGGGSTECVTGEWGTVESAVSAGIGAVILSTKYGKSPGLVPEAMDFLHKHLAPLARKASGRTLVGVGGTITSLAAIRLKQKEYDPEQIAMMEFSPDELQDLIEQFRSMPLRSIATLPGMDPHRADIIEAGATVIHLFMTLAGIAGIRVSPRGLRYGLILEEV